MQFIFHQLSKNLKPQ